MIIPDDKLIDLSAYVPATDFLSGQTILVTGAGDGIGKAISIALAEHGATVILLGRTSKKLELVYDQIEAGGAPQPAIYPLDLAKADEAAYVQLAGILAENFAQLHGLVHCAAILGHRTPIVNYDYEWWQQTLQVNLMAPFLITKHCYPLLQAANTGTVIFTSDSTARTAQAHGGAYSVSKAGIENLMQITACEWETNTNIRVNTLDPGPTCTAMRKQIYPGENPNQWPAPEQTVLPYLYLFDRACSAELSGRRFSWGARAKTLSEN